MRVEIQTALIPYIYRYRKDEAVRSTSNVDKVPSTISVPNRELRAKRPVAVVAVARTPTAASTLLVIQYIYEALR
jgi:hypothetical protein